MTTLAVGNRRLLKLADILDEADADHRAKKEPTYNQGRFVHPCGAPACALGHWAAHQPSRWRLGMQCVDPCSGAQIREQAAVDFALGMYDYDLLFAAGGCGEAKTGKQAARFIRKFVARRTPGTAAYKRLVADAWERLISNTGAQT